MFDLRWFGNTFNVTAKLPAIIKNHIKMDRYKELLGGVYCEPENEELHFENIHVENIYSSLQHKSHIFYVKKYNKFGRFW